MLAADAELAETGETYCPTKDKSPALSGVQREGSTFATPSRLMHTPENVHRVRQNILVKWGRELG
jgi:hypothetical protein